MANSSNTLRVLELMSLADLHRIADYRDLSTGGNKEDLARRIAVDVKRNLSELVSADGLGRATLGTISSKNISTGSDVARSTRFLPRSRMALQISVGVNWTVWATERGKG